MIGFEPRGGSARVFFRVLPVVLVLSLARSAAAQAPSAPGEARATGGEAGSAPEVELSDDAELARMVGLYEAGKYAECASDLGVLLEPSGPRPLREPEIIENARIYLAACLIGSGRIDQADGPLRDAILENPQMKTPDSLVFPPPVIERFLLVRETLTSEIEKAEEEARAKAAAAAAIEADRQRQEIERVRALERLAQEETVVIQNRRWIAAVPFGVGQFQNGDDGLGWVFLTSEAILGATTLTALAMQTYLTLQASDLQNPENNSVLETWNTLLDVGSYGLLSVAALGVIEAQLSFEPEVRFKKPRPLPPTLRRSAASLAPTAVIGRDGLSVGVRGSF